MAGRQDGSGRRFGYGAVAVEVVRLEVGEVSRLGSATSRASRDYLTQMYMYDDWKILCIEEIPVALHRGCYETIAQCAR